VILPAALRRVFAHRTVTAAAALTVFLAALTFAVLAAAAAALDDTGTRRSFAAAPESQASTVFTAAVTADVPAADAQLDAAARRLYAPLPVTTGHAQLALGVVLDGPGGSFPVAGVSAPGYQQHIRVLQGLPPKGTQDVMLPASLAGRIGVKVGDTVTAQHDNQAVPHFVTGIYQPTDADPAFWGAAGYLLDDSTGQPEPVVFVADSFLTDKDTSKSFAVETVWYAHPHVGDASAAAVHAVSERIIMVRNSSVQRYVFPTDTGPVAGLTMVSRFPELAGAVQASEVAGMSGFLIVATLLAVLAIFAVALTLRLVREHRAEESWLARARGADTWRLVAHALGEALLISLPALVAAPLLTGPLIHALERAPGLHDLPLASSATALRSAVFVSVLITMFCLLVQGGAAYFSSRERISKDRARSARVAAFQRAGIDTALAALAIVGYLEIRHYKSPVTSGKGALGIDPVLVLSPALTAAALAALALRLLPLATGLADRRLTRTRALSGALGGWQVSRRAARHAGTALLLVLALAVGAMAVTASAMRSRSAADRAAFQVGADARVGSAELAAKYLRSAYASVPGTTAATPLAQSVLVAGGRNVTLVGVEGALPGHQAAKDLSIPLPGEPTRLDFTLGVKLLDYTKKASIAVVAPGEVPDPNQKPTIYTTPPDTLQDAQLTLDLRDRDGVRFQTSIPVPDGFDVSHALSVPLAGIDGGGAGLAYPLRLEGFEFTYDLANQRVAAELDISFLRVVNNSGTAADVDVSGTQVWHGVFDGGGALGVTNSTDSDYCNADSDTLLFTIGHLCDSTAAPGSLALRFGSGRAGLSSSLIPVKLTFKPGPDSPLAPGSSGATAPQIPVVASDAFLAATRSKVGDDVEVQVGQNYSVRLKVVGRTSAIPGVPVGTGAVLVDYPSAQAELDSVDLSIPWTDGWLLSLRPGTEPAAAAYFAAHPEIGTAAFREQLTHTLAGGGFSGSQNGLLVISAATAPVFAAVGFAVSAVAALRGRHREFAVLRAMGARPRQLSAALWIEQAVLAVVAVALGVGVGVAAALATVPHVSVDASGAPVFPAVALVAPWLRSAGIAAATAAAVVLVVMAAGRAPSTASPTRPCARTSPPRRSPTARSAWR
jgi:hypothetical protein